MSLEVFVQIASASDAGLVEAALPAKVRWLLSATAAVRQPQALAHRIVAAAAYAIDPQTARLDPSLQWSRADDGDFKPSYRQLFELYLRDLDATAPDVDWLPTTAAERRTYVRNVLEFADRQLDRKRNSDLELFGIELLPAVAGQLRPERFLAPYRLIRTATDLQLQLDIWAELRGNYRGRPVDRVLAVDPRMLAAMTSIPGVRRAAGGGRLWLAIPDFRRRVRERRGMFVAHGALALTRQLAAEGELGLLGAGFELATLTGRYASALSFGTHLADNRASKTTGGPTPPFGYVSCVHDWVAFDQLALVVRGLRDRRELATVFCADPVCGDAFDELGASAFADLMFATVRRKKSLIPTPETRRAQAEHGLRARLRELDLLALPSRDLVRVLERDAARSPFQRAAGNLAGWAMIIRGEEHVAA